MALYSCIMSCFSIYLYFISYDKFWLFRHLTLYYILYIYTLYIYILFYILYILIYYYILYYIIYWYTVYFDIVYIVMFCVHCILGSWFCSWGACLCSAILLKITQSWPQRQTEGHGSIWWTRILHSQQCA